MPEDFVLANSKIAILGLGLMGGSLALGLRGKCAALLGVDPHLATVELARSRSIVDYADTDPANLLPEADLVILAAPIFEIISLLEQLPSITPQPCIVLDLGSTKQVIVEAMARLPERFDPIGGHPICGKESLSLVNAEATLYQDAPFLLTPLPRTTSCALSAAHQIIEAIGARPMIMEAQEHDRMLASTSHLPFLLSSALALATPRNAAPFIGPGFKSTSRLAGTSASMMLGVLQSNREHVLEALSQFQRHLTELQSALASSDTATLQTILNDSQSSYREFLIK